MKKVFTNGCFYILHPGHIKLFKEIKELFNYECELIVGVNSNKSTNYLKENRPDIIKDSDRLDIIKSIKYVDKAYLFDEETPYNLIKEISPDYVIKGSDYIGKYVCGADITKGIILLNIYDNYSTTNIIDILRR